MTDRSDSEQLRASREATDWLILLQEAPEDPETRRRFEAWLNASPVHEASWAATQRTADALAAARPGRWTPVDACQSRHPSSAGQAVAPPRRFWRLPATAAAGLAILFAFGSVQYMRADYVTGTAEISVVDLADGSRVSLAPDSAIAIDFGPDTRRVRLLAGEAFFQVAADPDRSFRVEVRDLAAIVLGTAFNVRREDDGATVALAEGLLRVVHERARLPVSETLAPGDVVRVGSAGEIVRGDRAPDAIAAWRAGRLIAQDETVEAVVDRLRRHYRGIIFLMDRDLAGRSVTGVYNLADPLAALRAIGTSHGANVRQITPWIVVISSR